MSKKLKILLSILLIVGATFFIMSCAVKDPLGPFKPEGGSGGSGGGGNGGGGGGGTSYLFDWEDNTTQEWYPDDYSSDQAFFVPPSPQASTEQHFSGNYSLKCHVVLTQGHANYDKGNMWVDLSSPINLTGKTVSVYIWVPSGLVNPSAPNGITLVFKDSSWKWVQCQWNNINIGGQWVKYSSKLPDNVDSAYSVGDITTIQHLGIKLGCGGGNATKFDGYIYIDAYNIE